MTIRQIFNFIRRKMEEEARDNQRGVFNLNDVDNWESELTAKEKNAERKGIAKAVAKSK